MPATPQLRGRHHAEIPRHALAVVLLTLVATSACSTLIGLDDVTVRDAAPGIDGAVDDLPPSCMDLDPICGAGAKNCCQVETVQGSTFYRSYDMVGASNMGYPATISTFALDTYEVTVGRFRAFVNTKMGVQTSPPSAGSGAHPQLVGSGWDSTWNTNLAPDTVALAVAVKCSPTYQTWTDLPETNENKPMNCVTWYEAMAFCIWDGGYLPTEAEWNYAASGGNEQRAYPWSNPVNSTVIDCMYANYFVGSPSGPYCINGTMGAANRVGSESPKGDGRWGHTDLAGNVGEWTLDWVVSPYPLPCDDCANLTESSSRAIRGGSFISDYARLRAAYRAGYPPATRRTDLGLRCARTTL